MGYMQLGGRHASMQASKQADGWVPLFQGVRVHREMVFGVQDTLYSITNTTYSLTTTIQ